MVVLLSNKKQMALSLNSTPSLKNQNQNKQASDNLVVLTVGEVRVCKCRQHTAHHWIQRSVEGRTSNDSPRSYYNKICDNSAVRRKRKKWTWTMRKMTKDSKTLTTLEVPEPRADRTTIWAPIKKASFPFLVLKSFFLLLSGTVWFELPLGFETWIYWDQDYLAFYFSQQMA